jgi:hypothetical protein
MVARFLLLDEMTRESLSLEELSKKRRGENTIPSTQMDDFPG